MELPKEIIDEIRKAFRDQLDGERAVDKLPPVTDSQFNWWVDQLKREMGNHAPSMPQPIPGESDMSPDELAYLRSEPDADESCGPRRAVWDAHPTQVL